MIHHLSPLRFPGGKSHLFNFLAQTIEANDLKGGTYIEPFAGGAGAALRLLYNGCVNQIFLNDLDIRIYKFWKAIIDHTEEFIELIEKTRVNISQWKKQKQILQDYNLLENNNDLIVGYATFYLNRCNRSGILSAGPIGGFEQNTKWKINARFNKKDLIKRIRIIASLKNKIQLYNYDAITFLKNILTLKKINMKKTFVYLDPPYYQNGKCLYKQYFSEKDHIKFANFINAQKKYAWIISYDDVLFIRNLYKNLNKSSYSTNHSANTYKIGKELIISSKNCFIPKSPNANFK